MDERAYWYRLGIFGVAALVAIVVAGSLSEMKPAISAAPRHPASLYGDPPVDLDGQDIAACAMMTRDHPDDGAARASCAAQDQARRDFAAALR